MASRTLSTWAVPLDALGGVILRYGLVAILLYLGTFKFTSEEAHAIEPLVSNSPLFSWLHAALGTRGISNVIGITEIVIAVLIAARPLSPMTSAVGSLVSIGMFLSTLSFLFSTPGLWHFAEGYPLPVTNDGGFFLIKDIFLLGAAIWTAGEALGAAGSGAKPAVPVAKVA